MQRIARFTLMATFLLGCAAGVALTVYALALPRQQPVFGQEILTPAPTLPAPAASAFDQIEALDRVVAYLYEQISPSVVHIANRQRVVSLFYGVVPQEGTGSGWVYDEAGHIVTNYHVVQNADTLDVLLSNGQIFPARIVGTDPYLDIAVVQIDAPPGSLTPLTTGDSAQLTVGQTVIAIGNPFGLDRTLTRGVISALQRRIETEAGSSIGQAIQTDAAINPGNSGGPLLDIRGRVVGMNTAINSPSGGSVGIGFAVPVNSIQRVVPSLIRDGRYARASLQARLAELGNEVYPPEGGVQQGLLVVQMASGSGLEQAGVRAAQVSIRRGRYVFSGGDILTALDGHPLATRDDLFILLDERYRPGDQAELTLVRGGEKLTVRVTLGQE